MDSFRWISVLLSMVIGLGITRLLSSAVAVFRSRGYAHLDWVPIAWSASIFLWLIQYWWALIELAGMHETWLLVEFLGLLGLALVLFVSAALILPSSELKKGDSLAASFKRDGRWALVLLTTYFWFTPVANWHFWGISPLQLRDNLEIILGVLLLVFLRISSRKGKEVITVLYVLLSIVFAWVQSPKAF